MATVKFTQLRILVVEPISPTVYEKVKFAATGLKRPFSAIDVFRSQWKLLEASRLGWESKVTVSDTQRVFQTYGSAEDSLRALLLGVPKYDLLVTPRTLRDWRAEATWIFDFAEELKKDSAWQRRNERLLRWVELCPGGGNGNVGLKKLLTGGVIKATIPNGTFDLISEEDPLQGEWLSMRRLYGALVMLHREGFPFEALEFPRVEGDDDPELMMPKKKELRGKKAQLDLLEERIKRVVAMPVGTSGSELKEAMRRMGAEDKKRVYCLREANEIFERLVGPGESFSRAKLVGSAKAVQDAVVRMLTESGWKLSGAKKIEAAKDSKGEPLMVEDVKTGTWSPPDGSVKRRKRVK